MTDTTTVPDLAGETVHKALQILGGHDLNLLVDGHPPTPGDDPRQIERNDPAHTTGGGGPGSTISIGGTVGVILVL